MQHNNSKNSFEIDFGDGHIVIHLAGVLDIGFVEQCWRKAHKLLRKSGIKSISLEAKGLEGLDGSGGALIALLKKRAEKEGIAFEVNGLSDDLSEQLALFLEAKEPESPKRDGDNFFESIGKGVHGVAWEIYEAFNFIGKLSCAIWHCIRSPKSLRWADVMMVAELAGVNSFWICATIGTLFGLILAFQSADAMKDFGAEIYVATLVSLSLFRVLGPFIAAVLFAARSGSAFAAEIGTMKVNEEIDALITMGLDPMLFLTVPRVISGFIFVPLLTLFVNLFGLVGMFVVMFSFGYSFEPIYQQTTLLTGTGDLVGGIFKAMVFGVLVAGVGCLRGLQTTNGSQAVGQAATRAVVSGIVLVVVAEGIFSVIFSVLGI